MSNYINKVNKLKVKKELKKCSNLYFDESDQMFHCNTNVPINCPCECVKSCPAYEVHQIIIDMPEWLYE